MMTALSSHSEAAMKVLMKGTILSLVTSHQVTSKLNFVQWEMNSSITCQLAAILKP